MALCESIEQNIESDMEAMLCRQNKELAIK